MEVFVKDETIKEKKLDKSTHIFSLIKLTHLNSENNENIENNKHYMASINSLDQHDLEIRADERKKVGEKFIYEFRKVFGNVAGGVVFEIIDKLSKGEII